MKKNLLFIAAAMAAASLTVQAEVTYEVIFVGTTSNGAAAQLNPGKGEKMISNGDGSYSCTIKEIVTTPTESKNGNSGTGFKIVSDDAEVMAAAGKMGVSNPGQWHTQFGASPNGSGVVSLDEEASPITLTSFVEELAATGHTPGEIQLAGGVGVAENVTFTFWPDTKTLKVTGTPTAWRDFGITDASSEWANPVAEKRFTHEGNGVYTLDSYDFGTEEGTKTFKIRPVTPATPTNAKPSTKPIYGFAEEEVAIGSEPTAKAVEGVYTRILSAYHTDSEKRRDVGDGSKAASIQVTLCHSAKANLTGKYAVKFDANTGELTLTAKESISTGVEGIEADDNAPVEYFNMQGVRVENPENGIFIRRQGNKVSKVVVK